jgi:hypothetical protein
MTLLTEMRESELLINLNRPDAWFEALARWTPTQR